MLLGCLCVETYAAMHLSSASDLLTQLTDNDTQAKRDAERAQRTADRKAELDKMRAEREAERKQEQALRDEFKEKLNNATTHEERVKIQQEYRDKMREAYADKRQQRDEEDKQREAEF